MDGERPAWRTGLATAHDSRHLARVSTGWNRLIEKNSRKSNALKHVVVGRNGQLFRSLLMVLAVVRSEGMRPLRQLAFGRPGAVRASAAFREWDLPAGAIVPPAMPCAFTPPAASDQRVVPS